MESQPYSVVDPFATAWLGFAPCGCLIAQNFDYAPPCHPELVELLGQAPKARGVAEWDLGGALLRMTARTFVKF